MIETALSRTMKTMKKFIVLVFVIGGLLGVGASLFYYIYGHSADKLFHAFIILGGLGFTFPMFTVSVRLMVKMYYLTIESMESTRKVVEGFEKAQSEIQPIAQNLKIVVEKSVPIAESVGEIVSKARGMSDDIETIAHKVRSATDALNGSFDLIKLGAKFEKIADSLSAIAGLFGPIGHKKGPSNGELPELDIPVPEFDPLKIGGGKRKG